MDPVAIGCLVVLSLLVASSSAKLVPQHKRLVVFRLGTIVGERGPGLVWLLPYIDRGITVDMREQYLDMPALTATTRDAAHIEIDMRVAWQVIDAKARVIAVPNVVSAIQDAARTTVGTVIGEASLDDILAMRDQISQALQSKLNESTQPWAIKIATVEIRDVIPLQTSRTP